MKALTKDQQQALLRRLVEGPRTAVQAFDLGYDVLQKASLGRLVSPRAYDKIVTGLGGSK